MRRLFPFILLLAVLGSAVFLVQTKPTAPLAATPPPQTEKIIELAAADLTVVRAGEIGRSLNANGSLRAALQSVIRAKVAGEIVAVTVREGDPVAAGQVLARIESPDYVSRLADREASLNAARAQAAYSESTRKKNEELLQKKFISSLAYDNARTGAEGNAAQVLSLTAQVDQAKKALNDTVVRSPIAGWLAERTVQRGDKTAVDGKLFTVVDLSKLELEAMVPGSDIAKVAIGQSFVTSVEGYGARRFEGRVARISPSAQAGSRNVSIFIEILNPDAALKSGLFAEGVLNLGRHQATALIPTSALRNESGAQFVYVEADGKLSRRPVEVGLINETEGVVEITKGIEVGARVIAANLGTLKDGARVRIGSSTAPAVAASNPKAN